MNAIGIIFLFTQLVVFLYFIFKKNGDVPHTRKGKFLYLLAGGMFAAVHLIADLLSEPDDPV